MAVIENRIFEYYKTHQKNIQEAIKLLKENGYIVKEKKNKLIETFIKDRDENGIESDQKIQAHQRGY